MSRALELVGFSGGHKGLKVVRDVDLHVDAGEVVTLLGPNGAGKTTTLLSISGLLPTMAGDIKLEGRSIARVRAHQIARRGLAHVPDDRGLVSSMSVAENLKLAARGKDLSAVYQQFPRLRELYRRRSGLLSGGEQQMLAVARALATEPKVLLIDEMSLGLAPIIVQQLLPMIREISDNLGVAVLLVEQHIELALAIADRAYVLVHGEVVNEGSAAELLNDTKVIEASYMGDSLPESKNSIPSSKRQ